MASIYGFTLKNRKTFQGLDWQGNQGDLHYKGKKVAWYNDSGNGGSCDIVYYDNSYAPVLEETIKRYFNERPIITEYGELDGDEDLFMAELLQLMDNEDAKKFYKAADEFPDIRYKTAMLTLLLTGMRRGELCGLEWSDIDFDNATITIARSLTAVRRVGLVLKDPKTESSKRVIAISDKLITVLTEYKAWYEEYREMHGDKWENSNRLFIGEYGGNIYPGTINMWMKRICQTAGLEERTVHSLRHTNITMQIAAGVPIVTVAGRAGHARTSTTTDIYSHFLKTADRSAAQKLEEIFD